jgi:formate-dependent nitrite reductase membrane component NrfD
VKQIEWGFLIVNYLFLGGLSAGLFFVSAVATLFFKTTQDSPYKGLARYGALLAPWPVAVGCLLLVFDLGRWYTFYKLFVHFRWMSPMSIGSWVLLLFSAASVLYCYAWLRASEREWLFSRLPKPLSFLRGLNVDIDMYRRRIAVLGIPLSVAVGIYTGVLLGATQARPFWNTNLVAQMFLFSALSTGCAALILATTWKRGPQQAEALRFLYLLDICFMTVEFFIVVPYLVHGQLSVEAVQDAMQLILGGPFTVAFWLFFLTLGLIVPLLIDAYETVPALIRKTPVHYSRVMAVASSVLVLMGGFLLRYVFVFAGQVSAFK